MKYRFSYAMRHDDARRLKGGVRGAITNYIFKFRKVIELRK